MNPDKRECFFQIDLVDHENNGDVCRPTKIKRGTLTEEQNTCPNSGRHNLDRRSGRLMTSTEEVYRSPRQQSVHAHPTSTADDRSPSQERCTAQVDLNNRAGTKCNLGDVLVI